MARLRLGRKLSQTEGLQTLYLQNGEEPSDDDPCVGVVISPALARYIVRGTNDDGAFRRLTELWRLTEL
jgi:hypothetical protein